MKNELTEYYSLRKPNRVEVKLFKMPQPEISLKKGRRYRRGLLVERGYCRFSRSSQNRETRRINQSINSIIENYGLTYPTNFKYFEDVIAEMVVEIFN